MDDSNFEQNGQVTTVPTSNPSPDNVLNQKPKSNKKKFIIWSMIAVIAAILIFFVLGIGLGQTNSYRTMDNKHGVLEKQVLCIPFPHPEYGIVIFCTKTLILVDGMPRALAPAQISSLTLSTDAKRMAYITDEALNQKVVIDGKPSKNFEIIYSLKMTEDGKFQYVAVDNNNWVLYHDNTEIWKVDGAEPPNVVSSDRNMSVAVVYKSGDKEGVAVNGSKEKLYDKIKPKTTIISDDGKKWAYIAYNNDQKGYFVVENGVEQKPYSDIYQLAFSPDNQHFAYITSWGNKMRFVYDGKESEDFTGICLFGSTYKNCQDAFPTIFSPGGGHYYFTVEQDGNLFYVIDGIKREAYEKVKRVSFPKNDSHFAYIGTKDNNNVVIYDGKKVGEHKYVTSVYFSPDGNHFAYEASDGQGYFIVLDGVNIGNKDSNIPNGKFSDDGKYLVYGNYGKIKEKISASVYRPPAQTAEEKVLGNIVYQDQKIETNITVPSLTSIENNTADTVTYGQVQASYSHYDPNNQLGGNDIKQNKDGIYNAISILYTGQQYGSVFITDPSTIFEKNGKVIDKSLVWEAINSSSQAGVIYENIDESHYLAKKVYLK